jgi:hypothetical protein
MKVEINYNNSDNTYLWKLWDGPDGIDYYEGLELDLGQCFEQIVIQRTLNGLHYTSE